MWTRCVCSADDAAEKRDRHARQAPARPKPLGSPIPRLTSPSHSFSPARWHRDAHAPSHTPKHDGEVAQQRTAARPGRAQNAW